jgi:Cyclic nucleotide-binding domain
MMQREAQALIQQYLRENFGRLLQFREIGKVRRAAGIFWRAEVVCLSRDGEIPMGRVTVNNDGHLVEKITVDDLITALKGFVPVSLEDADLADQQAKLLADEFADFGLDDDIGGDDDDGLGFLMEDTADETRSRVDAFLETGTPEAKRQALQLLPRLLTSPETRAATLAEMAELEAELGATQVALGYLEAACREFADRSNLEGLERVATLALELLGPDAYETSPMNTLLAENIGNLAPVEDFFALDYFRELDDAHREVLTQSIQRLRLAPGEDLVREGDLAEHAYVIESGQFSILLEAPDGSSRAVRCIFPGELVGEAAVLEDSGGRRTATIRADRVSTVWELNGQGLRAMVLQDPSMAMGIEKARDLRQVHSFFSMHETMGQLDVQVRDELLSCIKSIAKYPAGEVLIPEEKIPDRAFLVAQGSVDYILNGTAIRHYPPDTFAGLRDSIMALKTEGKFVVAEESTLVRFDGIKLRDLAADAPPAVVAVLERLE